MVTEVSGVGKGRKNVAAAVSGGSLRCGDALAVRTVVAGQGCPRTELDDYPHKQADDYDEKQTTYAIRVVSVLFVSYNEKTQKYNMQT